MAPKKKAAAGADQEADTTRLPDALPLEYLAAFTDRHMEYILQVVLNTTTLPVSKTGLGPNLRQNEQ